MYLIYPRPGAEAERRTTCPEQWDGSCTLYAGAAGGPVVGRLSGWTSGCFVSEVAVWSGAEALDHEVLRLEDAGGDLLGLCDTLAALHAAPVGDGRWSLVHCCELAVPHDAGAHTLRSLLRDPGPRFRSERWEIRCGGSFEAATPAGVMLRWREPGEGAILDDVLLGPGYAPPDGSTGRRVWLVRAGGPDAVEVVRSQPGWWTYQRRSHHLHPVAA